MISLGQSLSSFTRFLLYCRKLLFRNDVLINTPKNQKNNASSYILLEQNPTTFGTYSCLISYRVSDNLLCFTTECNPYPHFVCFFENK